MKATNIVHWPGNNTAACDVHTERLKSLGGMLMGSVSTTPCTEDVECENCKNEAAKKAS